MATSKPKKKTNSARNWKRNKGEELELPSGNVALVRRPGPAALLSGGVLPDTLMPIVQRAIRSGQGLKPIDEQELMNDPEKIVDALVAIDRLTAVVVAEPKVAFHKHSLKDVTPKGTTEKLEDIPEDARNGEPCACGETHPDPEEVVYTDEVDIDDKLFIFNYAVGGTRDLERFRSQFGTGLGNILAEPGNEDAPVRPGGSVGEG